MVSSGRWVTLLAVLALVLGAVVALSTPGPTVAGPDRSTTTTAAAPGTSSGPAPVSQLLEAEAAQLGNAIGAARRQTSNELARSVASLQRARALILREARRLAGEETGVASGSRQLKARAAALSRQSKALAAERASLQRQELSLGQQTSAQARRSDGRDGGDDH